MICLFICGYTGNPLSLLLELIGAAAAVTVACSLEYSARVGGGKKKNKKKALTRFIVKQNVPIMRK